MNAPCPPEAAPVGYTHPIDEILSGCRPPVAPREPDPRRLEAYHAPVVMDTELIEHLLHEDEGVELDFKQEQYPFKNADDVAKSELLKDILAFVNAWRRSTAYILIGVEEKRGHAATWLASRPIWKMPIFSNL